MEVIANRNRHLFIPMCIKRRRALFQHFALIFTCVHDQHAPKSIGTRCTDVRVVPVCAHVFWLHDKAVCVLVAWRECAGRKCRGAIHDLHASHRQAVPVNSKLAVRILSVHVIQFRRHRCRGDGIVIKYMVANLDHDRISLSNLHNGAWELAVYSIHQTRHAVRRKVGTFDCPIKKALTRRLRRIIARIHSVGACSHSPCWHKMCITTQAKGVGTSVPCRMHDAVNIYLRV